MKKAILIFGFILCVDLLMSQNFAQLRLSDTDVSGLTVGDNVYISLYIDTISPGIGIDGWAMLFHLDDEVVTWDGTNSNPMPGIYYVNPLFPPEIILPLVSINYFDGTFGWISGDGGSTNLDDQEFPVTIAILKFTYLGGETPIIWDALTSLGGGGESLELTLVNGCVCDFNDVTFHVTAGGFDLEGAEVTVGDETVTTNSTGIAAFDLPDGDYTYTVTKEGYAEEEGTFTVAGEPQVIEVEMEVCYDVTFHVIPEDSTIIIIGNDTLVPNSNGIASICLSDGIYSYTVIGNGYIPSWGTFTVNGASQTIEIILMPMYYDITFFVNCCGEPLEGIMLTMGTTTLITGPDGMAAFNLAEGDYTVEINGYIFDFSVPETSFVDADICSEVTFHVINELGEPLEGVSIEVNDDYLLTDATGEALTCLQTGSYNYVANKTGFATQMGEIEMDTIPQTVEIVMPVETWGITIHVTGFECDNEFEELIIICNGDTTQVGQPIYLETGSYDFEIAILGCPAIVTGNFEVVNASQTIEVILNDFPKAYIHVSWAGYPVSDVAVVLDNEDTLYTNGYGNAIFCVGGGNHIVHIPEYGFYEGEFTFNCTENTHYDYLGGIGINEINPENIFQLYPNPSSGLFTIENINQTGEPTEIFVTDITGRIVYHTVTSNINEAEIDLSDQPNGMYFVRVKTGEMVVNRKVIIQ